MTESINSVQRSRHQAANLIIGALALLAGLALPTWSVGAAVPQSQVPQVKLVIDTLASPKPEVTQRAEGPAYLDQVVDPTVYRVGPGDRLTVGIWAERTEQFPVTVTPEATVITPAAGEISVQGLSLAETKSRISERLRALYPHAKISVTLTEVRRFRVAVTGGVEKPGLHVVTANTRASEALEMAKLTPDASRRRIRLERAGGPVPVDLVAFERLGRRTANPYLSEGDVLYVPRFDWRWGTVEMSGAVGAAGIFDYAPGDQVGDLIDLAFGLSADADTTRLELWRFVSDVGQVRRLDWLPGTNYSDWRKIPLLPDDRLIARRIEGYRPKRSVALTGEFRRPGVYVFNGDSVLLRAAVDSAGGFTPWADLSHALILRTRMPAWSQEYRDRVNSLPQELRSRAETDWMLADALSVSGRVATDFVRLFQSGDEAYDVELQDGDQIVVPRAMANINVIGRVVQPGLVPHRPGADLAYYLDRVGGYSWQADKGGTFLVKGATGAAVKKGRIKEISAGDTIVVPTKKGVKWWASFRETLVAVSSLATMYLVVHQATQ